MRKEHGKLIVPVKRRRAMLASTPSRNNRPELIETMSGARSSRRVLLSLVGPDQREEVGSAGLWELLAHIGLIDSVMP